MVEQQQGKIRIEDTVVLSKDDKEIIGDWCDVKGEITDYWDISGGGCEMDQTSTSEGDKRRKMKLEIPETDRSKQTCINDNVSTMTADGNAMTKNCENGQCAMKSNLLCLDENENLNYNHNNNRGKQSSEVVTADGALISKGGSGCKNSESIITNTVVHNGVSNLISHQTETNTVGNEGENDKKAKNDVNDTVSGNTETSDGKDNCDHVENNVPLSIRDKMMLDSECTEERFRIDRKKLEQMLQAATEGRGQSGEEFFQKIMDDTKTFITWPSKLKIGAKSKKDPHIRICGKPDAIKEARRRIMLCLDTKSNRVTIKMDVSHTEHSHVIGKGGNNIKRVMQETGCHIHFPDSNRNTAGEKSNQVSITGHPEGVENARQKIRTLLPVVLQFEIPNNGLPIPDLNSPMIQHLVQAYAISIQFKQRAKVYSTSCTVRGSADNTEGLKTGIQTLMSHVARGHLPVTTQIEIAPQHHNYMLTKSGINVASITQATGARIIFPDPSAMPRRSTVYISGSIDSVILARHKLMGCLPLLLMFDIKEETPNSNSDSLKIAQMMETLELSINIKSKPKQPSRTVIIKTIECNMYNMFDARAKLLGLESVGVQRPVKPLSPKLNRNAAVTPTPVILVAHSHVTTPTVPTAVIGISEQKTVTPLTNVVLGGSNYVLTHNIPSNAPTPRPISALSAVPTPSQSPFPTHPNVTISSSMPITQLIQTSDQKSEELRCNPYDITNQISSPNPMSLPPRNNPITSNQQPNSVSEIQRLMNHNYGVTASQPLSNGAAFQCIPNPDLQRVSHNGELHSNGISHPLYSEFNGVSIGHNFEGNRQLLSPVYDPMQMNQMVRSESDQTYSHQKEMDLQEKMSQNLLHHSDARYVNTQGIITNGEYLQQLGITEHSNALPNTAQAFSQMNSASSSRRQSYSQNIRSPDSINESRTSDKNSPVSAASRNSNPRIPGYDQFEENQVSTTGSGFHSLAGRDLSPLNNQRSPPQIVLTQNPQGGFDSSEVSGTSNLNEMYQQGSQDEISTRPPPGFEGFAPQSQSSTIRDYESYRRKAEKAMENKPVSSVVRTPTDIWAGFGFSKSMPFEMKEELKKIALTKGRFRSNLSTTYENGENEISHHSLVDEENEYGEGQSSNHLRVPIEVGKGNSNLSQWRRRRMANMNCSVGGNIGLGYVSPVQRPSPKKPSAFTRVNPQDSLNRSSNSPINNPSVTTAESISPSRNNAISSPFNNSGNESTLRVTLPDKGFDPRISMNNTPTTENNLGLSSSPVSNNIKTEPDIADTLNRLGLSKYIQVFQQQEVDYQTFLTLTESDLKELGITTFGPRKKMLNAIKDLTRDRDIFSGSVLKDSSTHENIGDKMLQLQRLQMQHHRDNPQTTVTSHMDTHSLLSPPRQIFTATDHPIPNRLDRFNDDRLHSDRMRSANASRLWHNMKTNGSSSGHW